MSLMHFITGKGGVGKSTYAASLASFLADNPDNEVLLFDVQGSGYSMELLGVKERTPQKTYKAAKYSNLFTEHIEPFETFREYFSVLLAMGNTDTKVANVTSVLRDKIADIVVGNKAIAAFIHACPGLEPAVLLGKLEYETRKGNSPRKKPWTHIVVDAPSTGHSAMMFKSTFALLNVFASGIVFKQASGIQSFVRNEKEMKIHLVSLPEELPVKESIEFNQKLANLDIKLHKTVLNKMPPKFENDFIKADDHSTKEVNFELQASKRAQELKAEFFEKIESPNQIAIPQILSSDTEALFSEVKKCL